MSERVLTHSTFTIERRYRATPEQVFHAFADQATKARWMYEPSDEWRTITADLDFREGGREHVEGRFGDGPVSRFDARYHEIVDDLRLVYTYEMRVQGVRLSVSLTSVELAPAGDDTVLTLTEQGVYFDGRDNSAQREEGSRDLLEVLARVVETDDGTA